MHPYFGFFFATTTLIIAVPTAIKVYNWVLTLWRGDIHLTIPMLFALGFIVTFVNGGLTGLFLGNVVVDVPLSRHDVRGGALPHGDGRRADHGDLRRDLPLVPQDHRADDERGDGPAPLLGHLRRRLRHLLPDALRRPRRGAAALPRARRAGFITTPVDGLNAFISVAALVVGFAQIVFLFNFFWSLRHGRPSGGNPWRAASLEWQTPHTPPRHGNWGTTCRSSTAGPTTTACRARRRTSSRRTTPGRSRPAKRRRVSVILVFIAVAHRLRRLVARQQRVTSKPWLEVGPDPIGGPDDTGLPTEKIALGVFLAVVGALFALFASAYFMRMEFADWRALPVPPHRLAQHRAAGRSRASRCTCALAAARRGDGDDAAARARRRRPSPPSASSPASSPPGASLTPAAISSTGSPANAFFYLLTGAARPAHPRRPRRARPASRPRRLGRRRADRAARGSSSAPCTGTSCSSSGSRLLVLFTGWADEFVAICRQLLT